MAIREKFAIQPLFDKLVVSKDPPPTQVGKIFLPQQQGARKAVATGVVMAVGEGRFCASHVANGKAHIEPPRVKAGQRVAFPEFGGMEMELDGKTYLMIREDDILGVFT